MLIFWFLDRNKTKSRKQMEKTSNPLYNYRKKQWRQKLKILVSCPRGRTFDSFFTYENVRLAESLGEVVWNPYDRNMSAEEAAELIVGCEVYVSVWGAPRLDRTMLDAAPTLKLLTHLCATPFPFVTREALRAGVRVISGQSYFAASAAEGTLAYVLSALRNIPEYSNRLKYKAEWKHSWDTNRGLLGKSVGLINYNETAKQLARLIKPFGGEVRVYDAARICKRDLYVYGMRQVSAQEVMSHSEIIIINTPSHEKGENMIGAELLGKIRSGSLLVDTSRCGTVDRRALLVSLMTGRYTAVLDRYEREPIDKDDPFLFLPNVLPMPHMAGAASDLRSLVTRELLLESAGYIDEGKKLRHEIRCVNKLHG